MMGDWKKEYSKLIESGFGKASSCIKCGKCRKVCPQHLNIPSLLEGVAKEIE